MPGLSDQCGAPEQVNWGILPGQDSQYLRDKPTQAPSPPHLHDPAVIIMSLPMHLFLIPLFTAGWWGFSAKCSRLIKKVCRCCVHCPLTVKCFLYVSLCFFFSKPEHSWGWERRRKGGSSPLERLLHLWSLQNTISIAELMNNKNVLSLAFMQTVLKRFKTVWDLQCWSAYSRYSFNDFYLSLEHRVCSDTNTDKSIKADAICHGNYQDGSCFSSALSELCINGNSDTVGAFSKRT